jgi:hypothetical protein
MESSRTRPPPRPIEQEPLSDECDFGGFHRRAAVRVIKPRVLKVALRLKKSMSTIADIASIEGRSNIPIVNNLPAPSQ